MHACHDGRICCTSMLATAQMLSSQQVRSYVTPDECKLVSQRGDAGGAYKGCATGEDKRV